MNAADRKALAEGLLEVVELHNEQRWKAHECRVKLREIRALAKQQEKLVAKLNARHEPPYELAEAVYEADASALTDDVLGEKLWDKTSLKPLELDRTVEAIFKAIDDWEADS